jgi:Skp family chaperone for outer membrane proteins
MDKLTEKDPAQATAAEKARIEELTKKGQAQVQDFQTRQMKPEKDLSDADKTKLQQDAAAASQSEQKAAALGDKLANELREADSQATSDFTKKIRTATQKVAEAKGISIVFDMQVTWYAGTDITTAVVNELNK